MSENDEEFSRIDGCRRQVVKALGGGIVSLGATGLASAGSGNTTSRNATNSTNTTSGPSFHTEMKIPATPSGPVDIDDWESLTGVAKDDYDITVELDAPGDLPVDICAPTDNGEICVTSGDTYEKDTGSCSDAPLFKTTFTAENHEHGDKTGELSCWLGVDENYCVWVGSEQFDVCVGPLECGVYRTLTSVSEHPYAALEVAKEVKTAIEEHPVLVVGGVLAGAILLAVALYGVPVLGGAAVLAAEA